MSADFAAGMLENNQMKHPRSVLDMLLSGVVHTAIVAAALLVPLLFTNALDWHQLETTYLVAPPPPPPPPPPAVAREVPRAFHPPDKFYAPRVIPKQIAMIKERPSAPQSITNGVAGGVIGGVPGGQLGGVLGGILGEIGHTVPPPPPTPAVHRGPYRVGGKVQAPRLIHDVRPIYPVLARETRISGTVVIDCIIDQYGNVTQIKLISGHPLLVRAAFEAVQQWKYSPTLLNGVPVSVEMHVLVNFNLGS